MLFFLTRFFYVGKKPKKLPMFIFVWVKKPKTTFTNYKMILVIASQYKLYLPTEQQLLEQVNKELQKRNDNSQEE